MKSRSSKILVVGGLAAGPSAAAKAKRVNPSAEVTLFEATENVSYAICESPYAIGNIIKDESKLVILTPEKLESEKNIVVKTLHNVEKILPANKKILVRNLRTREMDEYTYDELIVCTGSIPKRLNVEGENARNIFNLKNRDDVLKILNYISNNNVRNVIIIGGGYIAIEMVEAFKRRGMDVTMLHQFNLPMEGLEKETRECILEELKTNGIEFISNIKVEAFLQDESYKVKYILTNRGSFEADLILLSIGVEPNTELARAAGIRVGKFGGIITDARQRTNIEHIYAAGDCCEVLNIVTGKNMYIPLATIASRAAWVAGENAAGGNAFYKGAIRAVAVKVFNLEVAHVGISSEEAKKFGYSPLTSLIQAPSQVKIISDEIKVFINLIFDKSSRRVLGANIYGRSGVIQRANVLSVAIQQKMTVDELSQLDMIYSPMFSPLWDPVLIAAHQAKKDIETKIKKT